MTLKEFLNFSMVKDYLAEEDERTIKLALQGEGGKVVQLNTSETLFREDGRGDLTVILVPVRPRVRQRKVSDKETANVDMEKHGA